MLPFETVKPEFNDELNRRIVEEYMKDESVEKDYDDVIAKVRDRIGLEEPKESIEVVSEHESTLDNDTEAKRMVTDFLAETLGNTEGIELVKNTQEEGRKVARDKRADMMAFANTKEEFDKNVERAIQEKGFVLDGLAEKEVRIVDVPRHSFTGTAVEAIQSARRWAKDNLSGRTFSLADNGGNYVISNKAIDKYLSKSSVGKSANTGVHISVLTKLPEVIINSIDAEIHPSYAKNSDGIRLSENGIDDKNLLVHRLYGCITLDGNLYRVKTTMHEFGGEKNNTPHSYEVTKIELLDAPEKTSRNSSPLAMTSNNSIVGAKLLENVEKSYDKGVKILNASKKNVELMQVFHGSAAAFDHFDSSHFLSGEGSMVYGAGHYVTNVEDTARMYAGVAVGKHYTDVFSASSPEGRAAGAIRSYMMNGGRSFKEAKEKVRVDATELLGIDEKKGREILDNLDKVTEDNYETLGLPKRQLYEIEIPDDNGRNYIAWEGEVRNDDRRVVINRLYNEVLARDEEGAYDTKQAKDALKQEIADELYGTMMGADFYGTISFYIGNSRDASKFLSDLGYVGIKVPTGNMRGGDGRGMNYVVFKDGDLKIKNRVEFLKTGEGTVYGWAEGNRMHFTPEGFNPNTMVHEYTHLWVKAVKHRAPELWKNIKTLLKDNPLVEAVMNEKGYEGLDEDGLMSEVLSRLSGKKNAEKLVQAAQELIDKGYSKEEAKGFVAKVKDAINQLWSWIGKELFGIEKFESIDEVTDRVLYDIMNKTDLKLSKEDANDSLKDSIEITSEHREEEEFSKKSKSEKSINNNAVEKEIERLSVSLRNKNGDIDYDRLTEEVDKLSEKNDGIREENWSRFHTGAKIITRGAYTDSEESVREKWADDELCEWAERTGAYFYEEEIKEREYVGKGIESHVYMSPDGKYVTKIWDYSVFHADNMEKAVNRIDDFNALFVNDKQSIEGITHGGAAGYKLIVNQRFYVGKGLEEKYGQDEAKKKADKFLSETYKLKYNESNGHYENDIFDVRDISNNFNNIIEAEDGTLHVIDAIVTRKERMEGDSSRDGIRYRTADGKGEKADSKGVVKSTAQEAITSLGGKGYVHEGYDSLNARGRAALAENPNAVGWYDEKTGEVHIYLPNCKSRYEAERTVLHEKVGHEGLRAVMGEDGYKEFCYQVWKDMPDEERKTNRLINYYKMVYEPACLYLSLGVRVAIGMSISSMEMPPCWKVSR